MNYGRLYHFFLNALIFIIVLSAALNSRELLFKTGIVREEVSIAGTGSMYPTFPKGEGTSDIIRSKELVAWPKMRRFPSTVKILKWELFDYKLSVSDIVSFSNEATKKITRENYGEESGFVKRVIALPDDEIEIRDGFIKINGQLINEPYTAKPRSTYGGSFLKDCQVLTVPEAKVFVMGDNRKESLDSRHELELISISDIDHVLPFTDQNDFKSRWRDTSSDLGEAGKPSLDLQQYLTLLNQRRKEAGLNILKYNQLLENSAAKRAKTMLEFNDLSFEASRSGYTMQKALQEVGYSNIVRGEAPVLGYYDAQELIENYFQFPDTKKFLLDKDFQETGLSVIVGEINNCPTQIIVQHLAGYVSPNYKKGDLDSWKKLKSQLEEILPGWEKAREHREFYDKNKDSLEHLIAIIKKRIQNIDTILKRMEANQWLTDNERKLVDENASLHAEQEKLATELNKQ